MKSPGDVFVDGVLEALKSLLSKPAATLPVSDANSPIDAVHAAVNLLAYELIRRRAEADAFRSRQAAIFDAIADAVFVLDDCGHIESVNRAAAELLGESPEVARGVSIDVLLAGPGRAEVKCALASGQPVDGVYAQLRGAGGEVAVEITSRAIGGGGLVMVARDRRRELATARELARLAQIVEWTTDYVGTALPDGTVTYMNPSLRRALGMPQEGDLPSLHLLETHPPWAARIAADVVLPEVQRTGSWEGMLAFQSRENVEIPVSQVVVAHRDEANEILFYSTIARDRRDVQRARRGLLDALPDLVFHLSADGVYLDIHESAYSPPLLVGREQLLGRNIRDVLAPALAAAVQEAIARAIASGEVQTHEYDIELGDSRRSHEARVVPIDDRSVYYIVRDVTESRSQQRELQRTRERLEASNSALEAFSASVSHDLRAPLRVIEGYSAELQRNLAGVLTERDENDIRRIRRGADRMRAMIDGLLELSRFEGRALIYSEVEVSSLARAAIDELRYLEPARDLDVSIAPGITVWGDAALIAVVIQNLVSNAWKFTSTRSPGVIEVSGRRRARTCSLSVRDNGVGFDPVAASKIFAPFVRLSDAQRRSGIGLGLATVSHIVRHHRGRTHAVGMPGRGAMISIVLPRGELSFVRQ